MAWGRCSADCDLSVSVKGVLVTCPHPHDPHNSTGNEGSSRTWMKWKDEWL